LVNGTLIWYFYICEREVWLMSRRIEPDQDKDALVIGRYLHENSYNRKKKEVDLGHIKLDVLRKEGKRLIIGEVKKSSRFQKSAEMQLAFYLRELKRLGIEAEGEILFPDEKKKCIVQLSPDIEKELETAIDKIETLIRQDIPPQAKTNPFCKRCAYQEFCWA
jgi:CRISPR-associated exonuclease Cas4